MRFHDSKLEVGTFDEDRVVKLSGPDQHAYQGQPGGGWRSS